MKACNDIDFLSSYWEEAKKVGHRIKNELPLLKEPKVRNSGKLFFINYKDMYNWSVDDNLSVLYGNSVTLKVLADKINYMILRGRANDVKPMLEKICQGRVKHFSKPLNKDHMRGGSEPLGFGHFRWNYEVHTLTENEINHIKKYFKL